MKKCLAILMAAALCLAFTACGKNDSVQSGAGSAIDAAAELAAAESGMPASSEMFTDRDKAGTYDAGSAVTICLADDGTSVGGLTGVSYEGGVLTVSAAGTYVLTGTLTDGQICVSAAADEKVQLVLSGVSVTSSDSAALYIRQADKVFVTLVGENTLASAGSYVQTDENSVDAAVFSKQDLTFNGAGSLTVTSATGHGIVSKDDLVFAGGTYRVTAAKKGLAGNNSVRLTGSTFTVSAGSDGVHAEHESDQSKGYIYVASGSFQITSAGDGMSASSSVWIEGGDFTIKSGDGSANASTGSIWGNWGSSGNETSAKGMKAVVSLILKDGTLQIDSSDDALHSNGNIYISGGTLTLASGDDGIHADTSVHIYAGRVTVSKSYEGIEGQNITVSGGEISVTASDDGVNTAGGADGSSMGRPGQNSFTANADCYLRITGGTVHVNAAGDGLDSNGNLYVSGGETYVSGPVNSGNGALDYDGTAEITGGILFAAGSVGMAQNFGSSSTQGSLLIGTSTQSAGTAVTVTDSDGNVLGTFTPEKQYQCVVISLPGMQKGSKLTVDVGGTATEVTMSSLICSSGNVGGMSGGMGGGMGGRPGMR